MIIAVSDLHLGWHDEGKEKQDEFLEFLDRCGDEGIDHLVLCGDVFDFWRRTNCNIFSASPECGSKTESLVKKNGEIFEKLINLGARVHYVAGNHDYLIHRISKGSENYPLSVQKSFRLVDSGSTYYFTHGYEIDVMANMEQLMTVAQYETLAERLCFLTDKTGWLASSIWKATEIMGTMKEQVMKIQSPPGKRGEEMDSVRLFASSAARNLLLGLGPGENLVFGHTHIPFKEEVKPGIWVGNTGCWGEEVTDPATGKPASNSYLKIYDGNMELHFFNSRSPGI